MMESQEFTVLYTHQKMKKSKVWQDGILKITHLGNKAILYDDKGGCLDSIFLKCLEVKPGDDLESDRYLITVEEVKVAGSIAVKQDVTKEAPELNSRRFISSGRSLGCQPAGLKRKFTGFQGPRQVPKKMVITENGESAASLEAKKPGPAFLSPVYSSPSLFSTVGKREINNMPADSENTVTYKNRERNGIPFSSVVSIPSFKINPEMLCEENYFCSPMSSVNKQSDSLLTNEAMKRDSLASHCLGVSQNIRSTTQILALLKSKSTSICKELNSEIKEHFPQIQPQGTINIPNKPKCLVEREECAEVKGTERLHHQHQSENTMRSKSRWAMYVSSQSSAAHSSAEDGNGRERKPKSQGENINLNLRELLVQKRIQFFETCAEKGKKYNEDKPVDNNDQSWDQEVTLETPSFCESNSLPVSCSNVESDDLSGSDIQENDKIPVHQNDQMCVEGSILIRENAEEVNICGTPEEGCKQPVSYLPECEHLQVASSLNSTSRISDNTTDMFSKSHTDNESLTIHEPVSNVTQPLVEVTFDLNNFETSDTEEESQESNKISQDSEGWVRETWVNDGNSGVRKRCEDTSHEEADSERVPLSASSGSTPTEAFPVEEALPSHFCALEGLEILKKKNTTFKQQETLQTYAPDSSPEARKLLPTVVSQAIPNSPHLNQASQQIMKENEVEQSEPLQSLQFFSLGSEEETAFLAVIPKQTERKTCDPKPVEFQGHQVKGSATSAVLVRGHSSQLEHSQFPESAGYGSCMTDTCFLTSKLPSTCMQIDFLQFPDEENFPKGSTSFNIEDNFQVMAESNKGSIENDSILDFSSKDSECSYHHLDYNFKSAERTSWKANKVTSPEQKISTSSPVSTFSLNSRDEDVMPKFSEESLKARTSPVMRKSSSLENENLQRLPLEINSSELCFPSGQKIKSAYLPQRQIHIPAVFQSSAHYKQIFSSCLIEHLNILLFGLAQRLHKALSKVDISFYTSSKREKLKNVENNVPSCHHHQPAKLVMVKKEGPNKGRLFYTCDGAKADRCKFFKWLEEVTPGYLTQEESLPSVVLTDIKSIGLYLRSQKIPLYEECQLLVRKGFDFQRKRYGKLKKFSTVNPEFYSESKSKLYLKLSRKEISSTYSKDDLWVVSKTLDFELDTFIACSAFFGPSSANEVELLPLKGYFPSNWPTNMVVHALLVCNASTELTTLKNIQDYFNPATLPLTQSLLTLSSSTTVSNKRVNKRKFIPPAFSNINTKFELLSLGATLQLASELIQAHELNKDQATALIQIAHMMASHESMEVEELRTPTLPITIIHGVFGAGKSYLLAVVILFFVQLFEKSEAPTVGNARPWKLLISSSTNVAVDRVLLGLLGLGFEKFVRVGSVRKIAKPILPYSLHAGSENENEQLKELHALMKEDLTPVEKVYVRKSIEQHKLGTNKTLLKQVRVVGATCAACPFPCMNELKFPVVVLDECSQITEPASLLPIARFECEKLILVGDPKQLPPTVQGSDAAHENGLEQTLFDRLCLMGHKPVLLRTQYRCHPAISAIANDLFYEGNLINGVSETERSPLLEWLPTLCFYNVKGLEQIERDNSFHNVAEAAFTLKLIQSLIASGISGSLIGVITLYKSQMYKLCHLLSAVDFDHPHLKAVQVSTVDAFQGAEKEIIILSCVRTRQVGFIDSEKRMNVALTRGRRHLLIVGNLACLRKNRLWGRVIQHCEGREGGLQHASQCEPQLNHLLKDYFEKQADEKQKKKSEKDKSKDKSHSQKDVV
ncbi:5'-3' DNA helicase ZGRF1 isoform X6 [Equus caballus]|uniref:5'-3' DNA helicase ZGRF1 isoform X6 n=1 Tax=Equus caballus TaxID=9796 RepID=UPI0038B3B86F